MILGAENYEKKLISKGHIVILSVLTAVMLLFHFVPMLVTDGVLYEIIEDTLLCYLLCIVLTYFLVFTPAYYRTIRNESDKKEWAVIALIFGIIIAIGVLPSGDDSSLILEFGLIGLLMAYYTGGSGMATVAALFGIIAKLVTCDSAGDSLLTIAGLLFALAAVSLLGRKVFDRGKAVLFFAVASVSALMVLFQYILYVSVPLTFSYYSAEDWFFAILVPQAVFSIAGLLFLHQFIINAREKIVNLKNMNDLALAKKIQASAIPTDFPNTRTLCFYGGMIPQSEVGGDFYDFFSIKDGLMAIVIADVSDKGLPAALFMMKAKATIKAIAMTQTLPGEILRLSNAELCKGNGEGQFVTAWVGILDTDMHILWYADAGHSVPYIRDRHGDFRKMEFKKGLVLGVSQKAKYTTQRTILEDGDMLFLYTDGVTEAFDAQESMYGPERLENLLNTAASDNPKAVVESVYSDVMSFIGDTDVSDDITMLCISVNLSTVKRKLFKSDVDELDSVKDFIISCISDSGCTDVFENKVEIVAEEIFVNICNNSYGEGRGHVTVQCRVAENELKLTFMDDGIPFNPLEAESPDTTLSVEDRPIGGLGIHLIRRMTESAHYKHVDGKNIFTVRMGMSKTDE